MNDVTKTPVESRDSSGEETMSYARAMTYLLIGLIAHTFTAPWVKVANFEPATSALLRIAIALFVLVPFGMREKARVGGINRTGILLSLLGGIFLGIDFTAFNYSIFLVGSGIAMVLLNMQVIILPALAIIFDWLSPPDQLLCPGSHHVVRCCLNRWSLRRCTQ